MNSANVMALIRNLTSRVVLADHAEVATGMLQRMVGLLNRATLAPGEALVLPRCRSIHTCFMRFPIDVIFLSHQPKTWKIVKVIQALPPFRVVWAVGADTAVELPAGTMTATTQVGELLEIM